MSLASNYAHLRSRAAKLNTRAVHNEPKLAMAVPLLHTPILSSRVRSVHDCLAAPLMRNTNASKAPLSTTACANCGECLLTARNTNAAAFL